MFMRVRISARFIWAFQSRNKNPCMVFYKRKGGGIMSESRNMIYSSISFIESRLSEELSINELAGQAFFSKTHYKRLFQAVVGEPVITTRRQ